METIKKLPLSAPLLFESTYKEDNHLIWSMITHKERAFANSLIHSEDEAQKRELP